MPIYEYRCKKCGKVSEFLIGASDDISAICCKSCKSKDMEKLISKSFVGNSGIQSCSYGESGACGSSSCDPGQKSGHGGCCGGACNH